MGVTKFVWDPVFDCVSHELDENNDVKAVYHNEPQQHGGVLSQRRGCTSHFHHHDALGSTRLLTDSSGHVTDTYLNDAWGNSVAQTGTTINPFKWVGKYGYYTDDSTGQVYVRARMYQPTVARWCSVDPLDLQSVVSDYHYAEFSPVLLVDPLGLIVIQRVQGTGMTFDEPGPDVDLDPLPPGADKWKCEARGPIQGKSPTVYTAFRDTCCRVTVAISIHLDRCFEPGFTGGGDPKVAAKKFYTKVIIRTRVLEANPAGCAENETRTGSDLVACGIYPGRFISKTKTDPNWPGNDDLPDPAKANGGDIGTVINAYAATACEAFSKIPWGVE